LHGLHNIIYYKHYATNIGKIYLQDEIFLTENICITGIVVAYRNDNKGERFDRSARGRSGYML